MAAVSPERLVVVGASAGGVEALQQLIGALPSDLAAAVLVVLHVPPTGMSVLPQILSRAGALPVEHAQDGQPLQAAHVLVAPPDHHLRVRDGHVQLDRGPRENAHRPAVDPLFRTAARAYGMDVVGVILSGARDDGTLGLAAIKQAGGTTIVQDPEEALYTGMPTSAIARVEPDHVLSVRAIAALIADLGPNDGGDRGGNPGKGGDVEPHDTPQPELSRPGNPGHDEVVSGYTCPECNGTLWEVREGNLVKLRCRVGHSYTEATYAAAKSEALEAALWTALQTLQEKADFARRLAERFRPSQPLAARRYEEQQANLLEQATRVRRALEDLDLGEVDAAELEAS